MSLSKPSIKALPPRIVIVNDEPYVADFIEMVLRQWFKSATITTFLVPEKALEELLRSSPDLLITDDGMPGLNGHELAERLVSEKISCPIIMTMGWAETGAWVQERASQGLKISCLPYPFLPDELRREVNRLVGPP